MLVTVHSNQTREKKVLNNVLLLLIGGSSPISKKEEKIPRDFRFLTFFSFFFTFAVTFSLSFPLLSLFVLWGVIQVVFLSGRFCSKELLVYTKETGCCGCCCRTYSFLNSPGGLASPLLIRTSPMSQVRRHGQGTDHHHHHHYQYQPYSLPIQPPPTSPLPPPPLSPPTTVRNLHSTSPHSPSSSSPSPSSLSFPLNGNLIPRDYLGPRSDQQQTSRSAAALGASRRTTPSPSPLHTGAHPQLPRPDELGASQSPLSPRTSAGTSTFQSRSPVGHLSHAAFPTPPSSAGHSFYSSQIETADKKPLSGHHQHDRDMTEEKANQTTPRKPSDTTDSNQSATSPISGISSLHSMAGDRSGQRFMPRTSSIDSAISSLSSASQSHKSTFDANSVSQADIGNLISTAGSAEAVIIHLLKEKHHAASQNSQLWRLVDKQRTLILGLNKDLERALKEKEKYKKKTKESQIPLPSNSNDYTTQPRGTEGDTVGLRDHDRQAQNRLDLLRNTGGYSQGNLNNQNATTTNDSPVESHGKEDQGRNFQNSQAPIYLRRELSAASPSSLASSNDSSLSEKPIQERIPHPIRKPPPAPLKLEQIGGTIKEDPESDSESEYEDIDAVDDMDRGRRKTRDDDDREREAALAKEDEQPSKPVHPSSSQPMAVGLPSSPRPVVTQSPPPIECSGSLASILSPRMAHTGSLKERSFLSSAPKSPGLPVSPRPEDRPVGAPLPRMPRELPNGLTPVSIPSSNNNISGLALSPRTTRNPNLFAAPANSNIAPPIPMIDAAIKIDSPRSPDSSVNGIYQGLISDEYPGLLLSPNALPLIEVKVASSRLRPSRNSYMAPRPSEEEPVFTLSVFSRSDSMELWRVEKVIAALPQLDQQVRQLCSFAGKLPDRSIFTGHSPAKIDARRAALTSYFDILLDTPMDEKAALVVCQFLTSDAIEARDDETSLLKSSNQMKAEILRGPDGKPRKEGYLTKRGKNFGGWKARYFVLHGPELRYFEAPGGAHLGTIKIPNAQIGKQSQNTTAQSTSPPDDDSDNQYRHAFLILEPKKKDSSALVRHVLCAESDEDRDAWVEALLEYVEGPAAEYESANATNTKSQPQMPTARTPDAGPTSAKMFPNGSKKNNKGSEGLDSDGPDTVQGFSFDDAVPAEPPVLGSSFDKPTPKSPLFPSSTWGPSADSNQTVNTTLENGQLSAKIISAPTNGTVIQDAGAWGNKASNATAIKEKKRSIWGFGKTRSSMDIASQLQQADRESPTSQAQANASLDKKDVIRPVFGIPLAEAVQYCAPQGVDAELPAVVYRCIEYLQAKGASSEEGIFRLSGSNVVIKALKERFNTEGDIDFLAGDEYYDVHAVASLFKQYLRELPTTVLTRELHLEFLRVLELDEREKKIAAFNFLVHRLPKPNLTLLRALSQFLIEIVNNSAVNKMTVRNVGIVFAPTLNIPAPVFSMFLTDYDSIFDQSPEFGGSAMESAVDDFKAPDVLRSPRRQVFSDMPTPSYNQMTFRHDQLENPRGAYDTGLAYSQPSHEHRGHLSENYNYMPASMNQMLNPNMENARSAKANRRESSMLFMESGNQNPSIPTSRAD